MSAREDAPGDGLRLRWATAADTEALVAFNARVHSAAGGPPNPRVAARTRAWLDGTHPIVRPRDFTVVEDARTGAIVSSLAVARQRWTYAGIPFAVGQIEFVGTDPAYRRRGLVRRQFALLHAACAARGEPVQVIGGLPWYYRQFGYELALSQGGGRVGPRGGIPALSAGEAEPFVVRPATPADLPCIAALDARARERSLVACLRDDATWRYELDGRAELDVFRLALRIVATPAGEPVGFLAHRPHLAGPTVLARRYELAPGHSWLAVTPSVLRYLLAAAAEPGAVEAVGFALGEAHPVYDAFPRRLPQRLPAGAYYARVPDLAAFVRHIAPALEARLARSVAVGHTGALRLNFYRDGLLLRFAAGRLVEVAPTAACGHEEADASFPDLTFLHLLFGHRALADLEHAFADCTVANEEAHVLLGLLFPRHASHIWAVG
jgi:ribosomal protein S18 acetylase RimI-like enzyme